MNKHARQSASSAPTPAFTRRHLLQASLAGFAVGMLSPSLLWGAPSGAWVNDVTLLNPIRVNRQFAARTTDEIRQALALWAGPVSIGGGRYSMGGQIAAENSLHLDMRQFNKVVRYSPENRVIRVQSGIRWRDVQSVIDPDDLSVKIMQSFANFTVGGALSVNAHGRYVGAGPMSHSVRAFQLLLADGSVVEASRVENAELFHAAIGSYGALGVITEVELDLAPSAVMERQVHAMPVADYPRFFNEQIRGNDQAILHNADLVPPYLDQATAITWLRTNKELTVEDRLVVPGQSYKLEQTLMWSVAHLPGGPLIRKDMIDLLRYLSHPVVRRNYEASRDIASLGPIATHDSTYALQEYFVPVARFNTFVEHMASILQKHHVDAVNVSVRHSPAAPDTLLSWAREEVFSFVLYYWQHSAAAERDNVGVWTRELIDAALASGGTYYLPYQLHATPDQFSRAYPNARYLFALKAQFDPDNRWRNKLWDKYYIAPGFLDSCAKAARHAHTVISDSIATVLPRAFP